MGIVILNFRCSNFMETIHIQLSQWNVVYLSYKRLKVAMLKVGRQNLRCKLIWIVNQKPISFRIPFDYILVFRFLAL